MDLEQLLEEVTGALDRQRLRWALIGGLALAAYGVGRPTADVDLVVELEDQEKILGLLAAAGFSALHVSRGYSNHLRDRDRLDLVYVHGETARQLFAGTRTLLAGGREIEVVRPEHLAAMKVLAMKNDPARGTAELADLEQLLQVPGVDREAIRLHFQRHGFEDLFRQLLDRLGRGL